MQERIRDFAGNESSQWLLIPGFLEKDSRIIVPTRRGSFTRALLVNEVGVRMLSGTSSSDTSNFELTENAVVRYCYGDLIRTINKGVIVKTLVQNFSEAIEVQVRLGF